MAPQAALRCTAQGKRKLTADTEAEGCQRNLYVDSATPPAAKKVHVAPLVAPDKPPAAELTKPKKLKVKTGGKRPAAQEPPPPIHAPAPPAVAAMAPPLMPAAQAPGNSRAQAEALCRVLKKVTDHLSSIPQYAAFKVRAAPLMAVVAPLQLRPQLQTPHRNSFFPFPSRYLYCPHSLASRSPSWSPVPPSFSPHPLQLRSPLPPSPACRSPPALLPHPLPPPVMFWNRSECFASLPPLRRGRRLCSPSSMQRIFISAGVPILVFSHDRQGSPSMQASPA